MKSAERDRKIVILDFAPQRLDLQQCNAATGFLYAG
jgi:hypothetical protein